MNKIKTYDHTVFDHARVTRTTPTCRKYRTFACFNLLTSHYSNCQLMTEQSLQQKYRGSATLSRTLFNVHAGHCCLNKMYTFTTIEFATAYYRSLKVCLNLYTPQKYHRLLTGLLVQHAGSL